MENKDRNIMVGVKKKNLEFLGDMSPIRGEGSTPLPLKKVDFFFRQNVKNILKPFSEM